MLMGMAHMGFGDGESGGQIVVNFAIGHPCWCCRCQPRRTSTSWRPPVRPGGARRWASAESRRMREPGHVT